MHNLPKKHEQSPHWLPLHTPCPHPRLPLAPYLTLSPPNKLLSIPFSPAGLGLPGTRGPSASQDFLEDVGARPGRVRFGVTSTRYGSCASALFITRGCGRVGILRHLTGILTVARHRKQGTLVQYGGLTRKRFRFGPVDSVMFVRYSFVDVRN